MMPALIVLGVIVVLPLLYVIVQYNSLVSLQNYIRNAWSNIDTELKRRYELIPNLVATVKGYAAHERGVLERVTELRNRCVANNGSPAAQAVDENHWSRRCGSCWWWWKITPCSRPISIFSNCKGN